MNRAPTLLWYIFFLINRHHSLIISRDILHQVEYYQKRRLIQTMLLRTYLSCLDQKRRYSPASTNCIHRIGLKYRLTYLGSLLNNYYQPNIADTPRICLHLVENPVRGLQPYRAERSLQCKPWIWEALHAPPKLATAVRTWAVFVPQNYQEWSILHQLRDSFHRAFLYL